MRGVLAITVLLALLGLACGGGDDEGNKTSTTKGEKTLLGKWRYVKGDFSGYTCEFRDDGLANVVRAKGFSSQTPMMSWWKTVGTDSVYIGHSDDTTSDLTWKASLKLRSNSAKISCLENTDFTNELVRVDSEADCFPRINGMWFTTIAGVNYKMRFLPGEKMEVYSEKHGRSLTGKYTWNEKCAVMLEFGGRVLWGTMEFDDGEMLFSVYEPVTDEITFRKRK